MDCRSLVSDRLYVQHRTDRWANDTSDAGVDKQSQFYAVRTGTNTNSDSDSDANTNTNSDADSDADTDTNSDADTYTNTYTNSNSDAEKAEEAKTGTKTKTTQEGENQQFGIEDCCQKEGAMEKFPLSQSMAPLLSLYKCRSVHSGFFT